MGTRYNSLSGDTINLDVEITIDNVLTEPFSWDKVEIYPTLADSVAGTNIIETIATGDITSDGEGTGSYTSVTEFNSGTYYDKIFFVPEDGDAQTSITNEFFVRTKNYGGNPSSYPKVCSVGLWVIDSERSKIQGAKVEVEIQDDSMISPFLVQATKKYYYTDTNGYVAFDVLRSTTTEEVQAKIKITYRTSNTTFSNIKTFIIPDEDYVNYADLVEA